MKPLAWFKKYPVFWIAILGTLFNVFIQEYNISGFNNQFPAVDGLLSSADESSYLSPPTNFLRIGEWRSGTTEPTSYFIRPPGMGIYFMCIKIAFGSHFWFGFKLMNILLQFLSVLLFYGILKHFKVERKILLASTLFFAFFPIFSGFMYFTITEAVSPFLFLGTIYYTLKAKNKPIQFTIFNIFLILTRPQLLSFTLLFVIYFFIKKEKKLVILGLCSFVPFILWNIRTIVIAKEYLGIHPIYSKTSNNLYRPPHREMTNLFRIWEHQSDVFHTAIGTMTMDTTFIQIEKALAYVPAKYHQEVKPIFKEYQSFEQMRRTKYKGKRIHDYLPGELALINKIRLKTNELKSAFALDYYVKTPIKSLSKLFISSHLNLRIFQADFRGQLWCEMIRYFSVFFLTLCYIVSCILFFWKKDTLLRLISFGVVLSFFYLSYVQRLNEERYLTPIIPICFILLILLFSKGSDDKDSALEKSF